jgi:hypothetical protein
MGWLDALRRDQRPTRPRAAAWHNDLDAVREATAELAGRPIDLSYLNESFLTAGRSAELASDVAPTFEGDAANAIIATYGGAPIGSGQAPGAVLHRFLAFGHHAACLGTKIWLYKVVAFDDGAWRCHATMVRGAGTGRIVGVCDDGSPLWEFRL